MTKSVSIRDATILDLIRDIVAGRMMPGDKLTEQRVGSQFEHSRGIAREALTVLEERGLLTTGHGVGSHIQPPEHWNLFNPDLLAQLIAAGEAKPLLAESVEASRLSAPAAAALAAERASEPALDALRDAFAELARAEKPVLVANLELHDALASATGNRVLARTLRSLHLAIRMLGESLGLEAERDALVAHAGALCNAVTGRDAKAARAAMRRYLDLLEQYA